jgi:hypothetical protein
MSEQTASATTPAECTAPEPASPAADESLVAEELDGMCGVY